MTSVVVTNPTYYYQVFLLNRKPLYKYNHLHPAETYKGDNMKSRMFILRMIISLVRAKSVLIY
jgi:hypothetical protein